MAPICAIERGEICSCARSLVTSLASSGLMRNLPVGMRKSRTRPRCGVVARGARARGQETIPGVVRHGSAQRGGALPLGRVAAVAICGRRRRGRVAQIAGGGDVRASQRESGRAVIKSRAEP
jgi:hypothetical protein